MLQKLHFEKMFVRIKNDNFEKKCLKKKTIIKFLMKKKRIKV